MTPKTLARCGLLAIGVGIAACAPLCAAGIAPPRDSAVTFSQVSRAAEAIADLSWRASSLARIAAAQAQVGYKKEARTTLNKALGLMKSMAEGDQSFVATDIAVSQAELGDFASALRVLRDSHVETDETWREYSRNYTLGKIAALQAKAGQKEEAAATFALWLQEVRAEGAKGDNIAIDLCHIALDQAEAGLRQASIATFAEAVEQARHPSKGSSEDFLEKLFSKVPQTLLLVAEWQIRAGYKQEAVPTLEEAARVAESEQEATTRASELCRIAEAQAEVGQKAAGQANLAVALQAAQQVSIDNKKGLARAYLLNMIAVTQARVGQFEEALQTASTPSEARLKTRALLDIAVEQAKAGRKDAAADTFTKALEAARTLSDTSDVVEELADIAAAMAQAGQQREEVDAVFAEAVRKARSDVPPYSKARALYAIGKAQITANRKQEAIATLREAFRYLRKSDRAEHVLQPATLNRPLVLANSVGGPSLEMQIMDAQIEAGDFEGAWQTARILDRFEKSLGLRELVKSLAKAGRFTDALRIARTLPDASGKVESLLAIAVEQAKAGQ